MVQKRRRPPAAAKRGSGRPVRRSDRPAEAYAYAARTGAPAQQPRRPSQQGRPDHAPLYDQDQGMGQRSREQEKRRRKKRRRLTQAEMRRRRMRRRIVTGLLLLGAVLLGILLSVALLFKVTAFEIQDPEGNTPADTGIYTQEEIIAALGIAEGDNLFGFRAAEVEARLEQTFPLLENIEVRRHLPGTVVIRVEPATETYCIQTDTGWAVLSETLKVVSVTGEQPALPVIRASDVGVPQPGALLQLDVSVQTAMSASEADSAADSTADSTASGASSLSTSALVSADAATSGEALTAMLAALDEAGILADMTELDVTDPAEISFVYQDRIRVKLGTTNELAYKLRFVTKLLLNESGDLLSATDRGTLDASHILNSGKIEPVFAWGDPYASPTPVPTATPLPEEGAASSQAAATADPNAPAA